MNSGEILKKTCSLKMIMRHYQTSPLFTLQGSEVVLVCEVGNLNNNQVVWKQGDRPISAGDVKVAMNYSDPDKS